MNICVLTHTFPKSKNDTTAAFMKSFVEGLVEAGNKVVLLTPYTDNFVNLDKRYKTVKYKYIWFNSWHKLGYSGAMKADIDLKIINYFLIPFMIFFGVISLFKTVYRYKINIINVHWLLPNGLIALIVSKLTKVPYIITVPGTDAYLVYKNKIFALVAKIISNSSAGIISNSNFLLKRATDLGIKNKPTAVISYPIDIKQFKISEFGIDELRTKLKITNSNLIVLAIGRLVYKKGFVYLIKAISEIVKKKPNVKLIIGGDGDLKEILRLLVQRLKIVDNVLLVGNISRNEMLTYYNLADIFVAPSIVDKKGNADGGPVVSYESMACGKAQIATEILGVSDIIKDGVNGYVVKQRNTVELVNALNDLLVSKSKRDKMGIKNRQLIRNGLSKRAIGMQYTRFIKQILKNEK
ncbi:MAG: group 1 glycosyl transferase [uncultured bacterium]|nr:MAG: group 1 glycosyl transferase [uncultured bacterium]